MFGFSIRDKAWFIRESVMFKLITLEDTIRIPPEKFGKPIETVGHEQLKSKYQEIVEGEAVEIADFGAFIRVGPIDALLHVSQIMDDYISYDEKQGVLMGQETT